MASRTAGDERPGFRPAIGKAFASADLETHVSEKPSIMSLPYDVIDHLGDFLKQRELSSLSCLNRSFRDAYEPRLHRVFRCCSCQAELLLPRSLQPGDWDLVDSNPLHDDALPRRSFYEVKWPNIACAPGLVVHKSSNNNNETIQTSEIDHQSKLDVSVKKNMSSSFLTRQVPVQSLILEHGHAKANFLALRHLRQIGLDVTSHPQLGFRVVRCANCRVYVGFFVGTVSVRTQRPQTSQHMDTQQMTTMSEKHDKETFAMTQHADEEQVNHDPDLLRHLRSGTVKWANGIIANGYQGRMFVFREFVELTTQTGMQVNLRGVPVQHERDAKLVRCGTPNCGQELFSKHDLLPWSHVMESTRLADLDSYLEYETQSVWGISRPSLFVKRLANPSKFIVENARSENLRQGVMRIADLCCGKCRNVLGWKFLAEGVVNGRPLRNYDQVGRYGIFRDYVTPTEPRHM